MRKKSLSLLTGIVIVLSWVPVSGLRSQPGPLPAILKTVYYQIRAGAANGNQVTLDPTLDCVYWYLDDVTNGRIKLANCDGTYIEIIKITSVEDVRYGPTGWSRRYFGYDPSSPVYMRNGSIIADCAVSIVYNNGGYSFLKVISVVNADTGATEASTAGWYYNL